MEPIGTFSKGHLGPNHVQANCLRELEVYLQLQFEFFQINFWKLFHILCCIMVVIQG